MSVRQHLAGDLITDATAEPIPRSIARVVPRAAERLDYVLVDVCQHCTDAVIKVTAGDPWTHRDHRSHSCLRDRLRSSTSTLGVAEEAL